MAKHRETMRQTSEANNFSEYYERGLWRCSGSPTGAHHWLIDDRGMGQYEYCGEGRQFAKAMASGYAGPGDMQWDPAPSSEEAFRERSPIGSGVQKDWHKRVAGKEAP